MLVTHRGSSLLMVEPGYESTRLLMLGLPNTAILGLPNTVLLCALFVLLQWCYYCATIVTPGCHLYNCNYAARSIVHSEWLCVSHYHYEDY